MFLFAGFYCTSVKGRKEERKKQNDDRLRIDKTCMTSLGRIFVATHIKYVPRSYLKTAVRTVGKV